MSILNEVLKAAAAECDELTRRLAAKERLCARYLEALRRTGCQHYSLGTGRTCLNEDSQDVCAVCAALTPEPGEGKL